MTHVGPAPASAVVAAKPAFVEWSAIFAGAFIAAGLSFVLLTFGTAIGLSATSPWPNSGMSAKVIAGLAVLWVMAQQIASFMAGGYIAGRLRTRWAEASHDEAEFRDGLHGGLVWAVGVVIGAALLMATAGAAARTGIETAGKAVGAMTSTADPMDAVLDAMLRPMSVAQAGTPGPSSPGTATGGPAPASRLTNAPPASPAEARAELSRILASSVASGSMTEPNRAYLVQLVAQRSGVSQQEAERRISDALTSAREAADKARKAAILTGFVTAASLLISFAAAWWAATRGGNHRDNSRPARLFNVNLPRRS